MPRLRSCGWSKFVECRPCKYESKKYLASSPKINKNGVYLLSWDNKRLQEFNIVFTILVDDAMNCIKMQADKNFLFMYSSFLFNGLFMQITCS